MELDYMILAKYAEVAENGLVTMVGGNWDTISVAEEPRPEERHIRLQGALVVRVLLQEEETGRPLEFVLAITDEAGEQVGLIEGVTTFDPRPDLAPGWLHSSILVFDLGGIGLARLGVHEMSFGLGGTQMGVKEFRVLHA